MNDALKLSRGAAALLQGFALLVAVALLLPTIIVVPMAFSASELLEFPPQHWSLRWWHALPREPSWMHAIETSLLLAVSSCVLSVALAAGAAYGVTLMSESRARATSAALVSPLAVPPILLATGLFFVYSRLLMNGTFVGLLVAHVLVSLPVAYTVLRPAFANFDFDQERAARSLGASRLRSLTTVLLPQLRPVMAITLLLTFLTSLDEVIVSYFVGGGANTTLTKVVFSSLRDRVDPLTAVVSTAWTALAIGILLCIHALRGAATPERGQVKGGLE